MNKTIAKIAQKGLIGVFMFSLLVPQAQAFSPVPVVAMNSGFNPKALGSGNNRVIGSFYVGTDTTLTAKNSTFQVKSNTKSIGKYLTNVRVVGPKGISYTALMNADGKGIITDTVTLTPGTHTFHIIADVKRGIPAKTKLQVVLEKSTIRLGNKIKVPFPIPSGMRLPLQNILFVG